MRILKAFILYLAVDFLCLFVSIALAFSGSSLIKAICLVCTIGVLTLMLGDQGVKAAAADMQHERLTDERTSPAVIATTIAAVGIVPLLSWILLMISVSADGFDFYRWHKMLNAGFLHLYNFINSDAASSALSAGQVMTMLPLAFVPSLVYGGCYILRRKDVIHPEK